MAGGLEFSRCCEIFQKLEELSSRNEMNVLLVDFYKGISSDEAQMFSYMLIGRIAPLFVSTELNFSEKGVLKILAGMVGSKGLLFDVEALRKESGDIGFVADRVISELGTNSERTSLKEVYNSLWNIANTSGTGSNERKSSLIYSFLSKFGPLEAKFYARIICGKLRLGCSDKTLLDVFSIALSGDKSARLLLDHAYGVSSDIGYIASIVFSVSGMDDVKAKLSSMNPTPGVPIFSRLVERVKTFDEVFERLGGTFYAQPKYDGLRCQFHKGVDYSSDIYTHCVWSEFYNATNGDVGLFADGASDVRLFSRNLEDMTLMFPEVVEFVKNMSCKSCILDGEVIGINSDGGFVPFQETMTRKRKYDVDTASANTPVYAFIFDIIYLDGVSLLEKDLQERLIVLRSLLVESDLEDILGGPRIVMSETREIGDSEALDDFFAHSVAENLEGLVVKSFAGGYQPGVRNFEWLKLKKSMDKKLVDTIDVVVIGYYKGSGKQARFGMGALLGAVYNAENDTYESVTKIGTGITEEQWAMISARLQEISLKERPKEVIVADIMTPDVWVRPEVVMSVEADEITKSSAHVACSGELGFGLALRFPRMLDFDRDKNPTDATSVTELISMYK